MIRARMGDHHAEFLKNCLNIEETETHFIVNVHGSTFAFGASRTAASQLGQHFVQRDATDIGPTVSTVRGDDGIVLAVSNKTKL